VSLGIFVEIFRGNLGQPEGTEFGDLVDKTDYKSLLLVAGAMATYPLLIERAGFVVASTVAFFGVSYAFGAKNAGKNLLISVIFSLIVYFSFTKGLNVNLPSGILGGI
jgi:putative tricarboxylic transport membrane protein